MNKIEIKCCVTEEQQKKINLDDEKSYVGGLKNLAQKKKNSYFNALNNFSFSLDESCKEVKKFSFNSLLDFRKDNALNSKGNKFVFSAKRASAEERTIIYQTGLFIGEFKVKDTDLIISIKPNYNVFFVNRMLSYANNIYLNQITGANNSNSIYLLELIKFIFLANLRKAYINGLPQKYELKKEEGLNIKGNIDTNKYIRQSRIIIKGLPYYFKQRQSDPFISETIYNALSLCPNYKQHSDLVTLYNELKETVKKRKIADYVIQKAKYSPLLNNSIYSIYKNVIYLAEHIIKNKEMNIDPDKKEGLSGWLLDISELWELYLYKLIFKNMNKIFKDQGSWQIIAQEELKVFGETFYGRSFWPDIVIKNESQKRIIIIDAKFKKMSFEKGDVDRDDIHQILSYSRLYSMKEYKVILNALVYPTNGVLTKNNFDEETKTAVLYLNIEDKEEKMNKSENEFIDNLKKLII